MAQGQDRQRRRRGLRQRVRDRVADRFDRRDGNSRLDTGRTAERLLDPRGESGDRLHHHRRHDLRDGARLHILRDTGVRVRGRHDAACAARRADNDGDGNIVPVACRFAADILRRREPCVGQEGERGEHAAVRAAGGAGGVPAVELLTRRSFDFGR